MKLDGFGLDMSKISKLNLTLKGQSLLESEVLYRLLQYYQKSPANLAQQYIDDRNSLTTDERE